METYTRGCRSVEDTAAHQIYSEALEHYAAGRLQQAESRCLEAVRRKGCTGLAAARVRNTLAAIGLDLGKCAEARNDAATAFDLLEPLAQPGEDRTVDACRVESMCLLARGLFLDNQHDEARPLLDRAFAYTQYWLDPKGPERCHVLTLWGDLAAHAGFRYEAEDFYRQALALAEQIWDPYHGEVASICHRLALLADGWEDGDLMLPFAHRAYEIRCALFGSTNPLTAAAQTGVATAMYAAGETGAAGEKFLYALGIFDRHYATPHFDRCIAPESLRDYALCLRAAAAHLSANGRATDAREFSARALRVFESVLGKRHPRTRQLRSEHDAIARTASRQGGRMQSISAWTWWRGLSFSR